MSGLIYSFCKFQMFVSPGFLLLFSPFRILHTDFLDSLNRWSTYWTDPFWPPPPPHPDIFCLLLFVVVLVGGLCEVGALDLALS